MTDRTVVYRILADVSQGVAGVRAFGAEVKATAAQTTAATKDGEKFRKGLDTTGRTAGRIGLIAAVGLGAFVLKAASFEQAMSNVQAATHETATNMGLLRDAAVQAGRDTVFSANEAADGITNLAKAGVSTRDILAGGLKGALDLAAAGSISVGDAAEFTATALTQFQLKGKDATHVADLLAAGAGKAQGEVSDMALALDYAGVPAANLGVTIEQTAGTIALFAKNGIVGEKAGTGLRGMLASLTSPSKVAKKEMDGLGISVFDAQGKFIGLDGVAETLRVRMKDLTDEERANALGKIFGNEQLQAANVLYREGGRGVQEWTRNVDDAGFAADTAAIKTDNLRGDLERLGGALDSALISGGQGTQGPLRKVVQGLTSVVDAYGKLPPSAQSAATGILAAGAVVGGSIWVGAKLVRGISDTREALGQLGPAGDKAAKGMKAVALAGAGLAALTAAGAGITAIQHAIDESLPGLNELQDQLVDLARGEVAQLGSEYDSLGDSLDRIGESSNFAVGGIKGVQGSFTGFSDRLTGLLNPIVPWDSTSKSLREANAEISSLDEALANLASTGHADVAADAFDAIAVSAGLSEDQIASLKALLPQYQEALAGVHTEAALTGAEHSRMATFVVHAGRAVKFTADQIEAAQKAYDQAREQARAAGDEFFGLGKKVDKAKVSLDDWIRDLEKQARALENFNANAKKAADEGLSGGLIDALRKAGPAGALRLKELANATDAQIDRANRAWKRGQRAIEDYVDASVPVPTELRTDLKVISDPAKAELRLMRQKFLDAEKPVITEMKVDNRQALQGIRAVRQRLEGLVGPLIVIRTEHQDVRLERGHAEGGLIRGPGTGTSDSISARVSAGEYIVRAKAVDRYGPAFFDRLNAMAFAQGGLIPGGRGGNQTAAVTGPLSRDDLEAVGAAAARATRPMFDNNHWHSDGDVERAMQLAQRLSSKGGG